MTHAPERCRKQTARALRYSDYRNPAHRHYVGALSVWADEQDRYDNSFMIADLHTLTIPENVPPDALSGRIREALALYLACGLSTRLPTLSSPESG